MSDINKSLSNLKKTIEPKKQILPGSLGIPLDGAQVVDVPGRPNFVYVRLLGNTSELIEAYNDKVSTVYDLPVLVARDETKYVIQGRDIVRYNNWGYSSYIPLHGSTHSFGATDPVWVYSEQFYPFAVYPSGTGAGILNINPYVYNWNGAWKYGGGTGTSGFTQPTGSSSQNILLLYIDGASSNPVFLAGTEAPVGITAKNDLLPYLPSFSMSLGIPLAMVRVPYGVTQLDWSNLYDVRQYFMGGGTDYGSMYADDASIAVTITGTSAYFSIDSGLSNGGSNAAFTFQNSRELKCNVPGTYLVSWSLSLSSSNNNEIVAGTILINSTHVSTTEGSAENINGGKPITICGTGIVTLALNDIIRLAVENDTAVHNITVTHANLSIHKI